MKNFELLGTHPKSSFVKYYNYITFWKSLEIIEREFPVDSGIKEQANVQRGIYKLTDNFFKFWYAYVFPNVSELELGDTKGVYNLYVKPELNHICKNVEISKKALTEWKNYVKISNCNPLSQGS